MSLGIRKVQYAPSKAGRQPCTVVRKDFMLSPGELELEVVLDKQVGCLLFNIGMLFHVVKKKKVYDTVSSNYCTVIQTDTEACSFVFSSFFYIK